jgi:N-acetylmuramoyl-L-alanine amidase
VRRQLRGLSAGGAAGGRLGPVALAAVALAACSPARAVSAGAQPLVLLDPGHGPAHPGAVSVRGTEEVGYNDAFAALLAPKLQAAGFRVALTRRPGEEPPLVERARQARERGAWLLLSLHHDSAQPQFLERVELDGRPAFRTVRAIRGYSLFVSGRNARYAASLRAAEALGRRILALGRPPTLHHAEPIPGEGRPLLDAGLGIYRFDDLKVLRLAPCPAVLLELGVLPDEADEAYVADPARQEALAGAVVRALVDVRDGAAGAAGSAAP